MSTEQIERPTAEGFGAVVLENGVHFRTWAPNASSVAVSGSFNDWSQDGDPLELEGDGVWAGFVKGAQQGDEYKFVLRNGEQVLVKNDPYARQLTNSNGNSIIYKDTFDWEGDEFHPQPLNQLVIYELHIGSFNAWKKGAPGTFESVVAKLDYLQDLGINCIELMPVAEFPGGFSWGYNVAHPFAVESDYGGPDALKRLVKEAHARGIAVLLDVVYNHFGPSDLDLWQYDGWSENGKGGIYFFNDWRADTPWGSTRPDYGREEVRRYIIDNASMWLGEFRFDGLRWDATCYISDSEGSSTRKNLDIGWEFMRWANGVLRERFPSKYFFAEDLKDDHLVTETIENGGAGFHGQWDPRFVHPVRNELILLSDEDRRMERIVQAIQHRFNNDAFRRVIYTESHDETANGKQRLPQEISADNVEDRFAMKRSMLGALIVMTAPGVPMILQGQEFLEDEWFRDDDPLEWERTKRFSGVHAFYKDLIRLRLNKEGHSGGLCASYLNIFHLNHEAGLIAYQRASSAEADDDVIVILNFKNHAYRSYRIGFPKDGHWSLRLNSDSKHYSSQFDDFHSSDVQGEQQAYDGMPYSQEIDIGCYGALVYTRSS